MAVGYNIAFPIYVDIDGVKTPFHDLALRKATVDSVVMSLGGKITGDIVYADNSLVFSMREYVEYNDTKYYIVNPPTVTREGMVSENSGLNGVTKYSLEFYHPEYWLSDYPFADVAVRSGEERYLSQNKTFSWIGTLEDYVDKLNENLDGTEWKVVISSTVDQEVKGMLSDVLQFDDNTIADALKTLYDTWKTPFTTAQLSVEEHGKKYVVTVGLPSNEIYENVDDEEKGQPFVFMFGQGVGLKNNSRTSKNNKIITRIAPYGSENNIPYGYPQIIWYGNQDWDYSIDNNPNDPNSYPIYKGIVGGQYVKLIKHPFTRTHLMPSIYSQTVFNKVSPYLSNGRANPSYSPAIEIKDYYDAIATQEYPYTNEINPQAPSYESHEFAEIKPELDSDRQLDIVSAIPLNQDLTPASQWDDTYDAEKDEYVQSYFRITLPQLDFDLYACAAITQEMQINMRSGACIGCTFPVQVDWEDYKKNFYDEDGNFAPDGQQRDLTKYPKSNLGQINVVVQKDLNTFGTLMPNIYKQPTEGDNFVILGISLPLSYIENAEIKLDVVAKEYMLENNIYYYEYPLKFDEYFLATHTNILSQIKPNSVIRFQYASEELKLYVKQITVKYGESPLPKYDITLTDNIEVVLNQIGQAASDIQHLGTLFNILNKLTVTQSWIEKNYVSIPFFEKIFGVYNGNTRILTNSAFSSDSGDISIKANFGLYTEQFLSALGLNNSGGGGGGGASVLADLNDVEYNGMPVGGQVLKYNGSTGKWYNGADEGITTVIWSNVTGKPTTLLGYGITDAKIEGGVITLGNNSITPLTSHQTIYALSVYGGTTKVMDFVPNSAAASLYIKAGGDITLTTNTTSKEILLSYIHPTNGANKTITAANGKVLSAITVNSLGHVTSVSDKTLAADDIPNLSWNKITSDKPTTLAGYGIADALSNVTTFFGQTVSNGVVSGNMTGVGNISFASTGKNIGSVMYFDTVNSRIGVGNSSPTRKLDVNGTFYASGNSAIGGTLSVSGPATLSSSLTVDTILHAADLDLFVGNAENEKNITFIEDVRGADLSEYSEWDEIETSWYISTGGDATFKNVTTSEKLAVGSTLRVSGILSANGGIVVPSNKTIKIGDGYLSWDSTNNAIRVSANADGTGAVNFYAIGGVSALGQSNSGSGGGGASALSELTDVLLSSLANGDLLKYNGTHWVNVTLGTLMASYATTSWVSSNYATQTSLSGYMLRDVVDDTVRNPNTGNPTSDLINGDEVLGFISLGNDGKIHTHYYNLNVDVPAHLSDLDNDLVPSWALQSTKPSYGFSEITGTVTNAQLAGSISADKLAGSIPNAKLSNSSVTVNGTNVSLGGTITTTKWGTSRTLWGQSVDGSKNISGAMTGVTSIANTNASSPFITFDETAMSGNGAMNIDRILSVNSAAYFEDTVDFEDQTAFAKQINANSTLAVTGATTLSSTLSVSGAATLSSTLGVTGNTTLGGTLGVTGAATLGSTLSVSGATTMNSPLTINSSDNEHIVLTESGVGSIILFVDYDGLNIQQDVGEGSGFNHALYVDGSAVFMDSICGRDSSDNIVWSISNIGTATLASTTVGGTLSVSDNITLANAKNLFFKDSSNNPISVLNMQNNNVLVVGAGMTNQSRAYNTVVRGNSITLQSYYSTDYKSLATFANTGITTTVGMSVGGAVSASGNISSAGTLSCQGDISTSGGNIYTKQGNGAYIQIGAIRIGYDIANNALKVYKFEDNSEKAANFYALGGVSALGQSNSGGGGGGGASSLADLNDVSLTSPASGDVLKYNGTHWVNVTLATLMTNYATTSWVNTNYATKTSLSGYMLRDVVDDTTYSQGIPTTSIIDGDPLIDVVSLGNDGKVHIHYSKLALGVLASLDGLAFSDLTSHPTTLSGYGISDAVTLNTTQTISGGKTFTAMPYLNTSANNYPYIGYKSGNVWWGSIGFSNADIPSFYSPTDTRWYGFLTLKNYASYVLPLSGGSMSNTNLVTNLNADLLDGYEANEISKVWYTLCGSTYSSETNGVKWFKIASIATTQGDNIQNDFMLEIWSYSDQNYASHIHGYLRCTSYHKKSTSIVLSTGTSRSTASGPYIYATIDSERNVWIGIKAFYTCRTCFRILQEGSVNTIVKSNWITTDTAPDSTYITNNGALKNFSGTNGTVEELEISNVKVSHAQALSTQRTLWGQSFDGTANVSGNMTGVGSIAMSGNLTTSQSVLAGNSGSSSGERHLMVQTSGAGNLYLFANQSNKGLCSSVVGSGQTAKSIRIIDISKNNNSVTFFGNLKGKATELNATTVPYNRPIANGGNGKQWERFGVHTNNNIDDGSEWYSYNADLELYINGYQTNGKATYIGKISLCVSVHNEGTLKEAKVTAIWQLCKKYYLPIDHVKAVVTKNTVEFFVLNDIWDTAISMVIINQNDGINIEKPTVENQYTADEFSSYCSDKKVIDSTTDQYVSIGRAETLETSHTLWGQSFNGSANVSGAMSSVSSIDSLIYFDTTNSRVGIGTSSPSYKLYVGGTFYASGNSSIGGTLGVTGATTLSSLTVNGATTFNNTINIGSSEQRANVWLYGGVQISGEITASEMEFGFIDGFHVNLLDEAVDGSDYSELSTYAGTNGYASLIFSYGSDNLFMGSNLYMTNLNGGWYNLYAQSISARGSLSVTGGTTLSSTLSVLGAATLSSTLSVANDITLANNKSFKVKNSGGTALSAMVMTNGNAFILGYDMIANNYVTYLRGSNVDVQVRNSSGTNTSIMTFSSGSILVNNSYPISHPSNTDLFIGNSSNIKKVKLVEDMAGWEDGALTWELDVDGTAWFKNTTVKGNFTVKDSNNNNISQFTSSSIHAYVGFYSDSYVSALGQNTSSDIRMKDVMGYNALPTVEQVANAPAIRYLWKDKRDLGLQVGSVAQYWQQVLPESIREDESGMLSMQYGVISLLSTISVARKVVNHEERIKELEKENQRLRTELEQIRLLA